MAYRNHLIKDSTVIALIAYLQRLGKDVNRVETPAATTPAAPSPTTTFTPPSSFSTIASYTHTEK